MTEGVDYSFARPGVACLANAGKRFAVRYVGTPSSGKNLTAREADALRVAGVEIVAVYETTAGFMLDGFASGAAAARRAVTDASAYGLPPRRPIYFALDVDPGAFSTDQWTRVRAFLEGANSVIGRARVGVYGAAVAIDRLVPEYAAFGWQTYAWSRGRLSPRAHLYQYRNGVSLCGGVVDLCKSLAPDYGQWGYSAAPTPAPPPTLEDDVIKLVRRPRDGAYMLVFGHAKMHMRTTTEAAQWIWVCAVAGDKISTGPNHSPHEWLDEQVDRLDPVTPGIDDVGDPIEYRALRGDVDVAAVPAEPPAPEALATVDDHPVPLFTIEEGEALRSLVTL